MKRLIECVPNFSEGRNLAKVDALVDAMSCVPGAWVLDRTSDPDHNRSVITLAGEPEAVAEAAIRGVGAAADIIDMRHQTGAHPRIGATDVLPFVPLEGSTIDECVTLARRVGQEIWGRYRIPVYFYEAAATRPERVNLEDVRKGQFERLLADAMRNPDRSPDIGEPRLHPTTGATAIGVRKLLIAYNIHLNTNDAAVAKKIAKAIRFSSGGLRYVKAIGVDLKSRGQAQVSINLTDFEETPVHRVFEMVKREAERHGCAVTGSEIVGLIPRKAVEMAAQYYLQLENFSPDRVLENRIATISGDMLGQATEQCDGSALAGQLLDTLRRAAGDLGVRITAEADANRALNEEAEKETAEAYLEIALAATQVFEQWIQLASQADASMLPEVRVGRRMAKAAAQGALENVEAALGNIRELGHDLTYVSGLKSHIAAIETRLSADPSTAGMQVRSSIESWAQGRRK